MAVSRTTLTDDQIQANYDVAVIVITNSSAVLLSIMGTADDLTLENHTSVSIPASILLT